MDEKSYAKEVVLEREIALIESKQSKGFATAKLDELLPDIPPAPEALSTSTLA